MSEQVSAALANDVSVRWSDATTAEVVVQVRCEDCDQDQAQALSRAWTAIAEAISVHKAQEASPAVGQPPAEGDPGDTPPGTHTWWKG